MGSKIFGNIRVVTSIYVGSAEKLTKENLTFEKNQRGGPLENEIFFSIFYFLGGFGSPGPPL